MNDCGGLGVRPQRDKIVTQVTNLTKRVTIVDKTPLSSLSSSDKLRQDDKICSVISTCCRLSPNIRRKLVDNAEPKSRQTATNSDKA